VARPGLFGDLVLADRLHRRGGGLSVHGVRRAIHLSARPRRAGWRFRPVLQMVSEALTGC